MCFTIQVKRYMYLQNFQDNLTGVSTMRVSPCQYACLPLMASSGTFPSGELFCTTGETMSDISRQQNKRSSINGCHSNISLLESFLKYNSWFHYISILRTTFYNQNKFKRYDSLGDIHHMNLDFIWKTYFRLTSNRMYLMQCNVGYMGLVAAAINNPVLATCNWSLR